LALKLLFIIRFFIAVVENVFFILNLSGRSIALCYFIKLLKLLVKGNSNILELLKRPSMNVGSNMTRPEVIIKIVLFYRP
jgi:hypothetical protein